MAVVDEDPRGDAKAGLFTDFIYGGLREGPVIGYPRSIARIAKALRAPAAERQRGCVNDRQDGYRPPGLHSLQPYGEAVRCQACRPDEGSQNGIPSGRPVPAVSRRISSRSARRRPPSGAGCRYPDDGADSRRTASRS